MGRNFDADVLSIDTLSKQISGLRHYRGKKLNKVRPRDNNLFILLMTFNTITQTIITTNFVSVYY